MSSKMMGKAHKMDHLLKRFGRSENGMILIWVAVLLPVLFVPMIDPDGKKY